MEYSSENRNSEWYSIVGSSFSLFFKFIFIIIQKSFFFFLGI
jgi:hypothetical protein